MTKKISLIAILIGGISYLQLYGQKGISDCGCPDQFSSYKDASNDIRLLVRSRNTGCPSGFHVSGVTYGRNGDNGYREVSSCEIVMGPKPTPHICVGSCKITWEYYFNFTSNTSTLTTKDGEKRTWTKTYKCVGGSKKKKKKNGKFSSETRIGQLSLSDLNSVVDDYSIFPSPIRLNQGFGINGLSEGDVVIVADLAGKLLAKINVTQNEIRNGFNDLNLSYGLHLIHIKGVNANGYIHTKTLKLIVVK